jgi:hypothetical protein
MTAAVFAPADPISTSSSPRLAASPANAGGRVRLTTNVEMIRGVDGVIDVDSHLHHREPNPSLPKPPWMLGAR